MMTNFGFGPFSVFYLVLKISSIIFTFFEISLSTIWVSESQFLTSESFSGLP